MSKPIQPCKVCQKKTTVECSHVDCPNRKRVTAQPTGDQFYINSKVENGAFVPAGAGFRKIPKFEE